MYLEDHIWSALHARARRQGTTISELVRQAVRQQYLGGREGRARAMREFIGIRKERTEPLDAVEYVRELRRGDRLERLRK